jgi:hypothetical protein
VLDLDQCSRDNLHHGLDYPSCHNEHDLVLNDRTIVILFYTHLQPTEFLFLGTVDPASQTSILDEVPESRMHGFLAMFSGN